MSYTLKELIAHARKAFTSKDYLNTLHQELALNFYPERADFTFQRQMGDEFASHMMTGYPSMVRRDLGNAFAAMLRPSEKEWFEMKTNRKESEDHAAKVWLETMTKRQRWYMYQRQSGFARATKEADHDFATFGQCVISIELVYDPSVHYLYRTWHLRDVAWYENSHLVIDQIFRRWKPTIKDLEDLFGKDALHTAVQSKGVKNRMQEINCMHIVVPSEMFEEQGKFRTKYVNVYIDVENEHLISAYGSRTKTYVIPRWQTVSGSQYGYSPAAITALPDARLIQAITLVLLEAGERYVLPPMLAVSEAIRGDLALYSGGVTWSDPDYDERLGEVLRPLTTDKGGMPIGFEIAQGTRAQIAEAFYISKLTLPQVGGDMTAYEVGKRVEEYVRQALPLFEPMEMDYNGTMCEETFELGFMAGMYGSPSEIPASIRGADVEFKFASPLHDQEGRQDANRYVEASQILGNAINIDPTIVYNVDIHKAFRAALEGLRVPTDWLVDDKAVQKRVHEEKAKQKMQEVLATAGMAAETMKQGGEAQQAINDAQQPQAAQRSLV